jgi:hypothetical protein
MIGEMAKNDPDSALEMLMDRDGFSQQVRMKEMDHYRNIARERVRFEHDEDSRLQSQEFTAGENELTREHQTGIQEQRNVNAATDLESRQTYGAGQGSADRETRLEVAKIANEYRQRGFDQAQAESLAEDRSFFNMFSEQAEQGLLPDNMLKQWSEAKARLELAEQEKSGGGGKPGDLQLGPDGKLVEVHEANGGPRMTPSH